MREERVIGVDLGGTKILAGLVGRDGTIGRTIEIPTPDGAQEQVLAAIDKVVEDLLGDGAAAIGYGVPLNIDRRTGVALRATNLPLHAVHFPDRARGRYGLPAGVENDGNAAALAEWRGFLFVNLAEKPVPFAEAFAALEGKFEHWRVEELRSVHQTTYEVEANWKLFFHNYSECYHCPNVHPHLNKLTPYKNTENDLDEGPVLGGPMWMSNPEGSMTMHGGRCAAPFAELSDAERGRVFYYTLFPGAFLSFHPDYVLVHRAKALAIGRTQIVCDWYFHPEAIAAPGFDPQPAIDFWDLTNRQDWQLCTDAYKGVSSRAWEPGPYSELESQLAAFDRQYLRALGVEDPASRLRRA